MRSGTVGMLRMLCVAGGASLPNRGSGEDEAADAELREGLVSGRTVFERRLSCRSCRRSDVSYSLGTIAS